MEKVVECSVKVYKSKWHGTQVRTQDSGVGSGGLLWGEQGTPAHQVPLIVRWDVGEPVGQRRLVLTCTLRSCNRVLCGTVLYWGQGACAVLGECA